MSRVLLNDIDDFILPSQACVNPNVKEKLEKRAAEEKEGEKKTSDTKSKKNRQVISLESDATKSDFFQNEMVLNSFKDVSTSSSSTSTKSEPKSVATISLNDCLACSGCVTSSESILIQEQSTQKFYQYLEEKKKDSNGVDIVVIVSINSCASIGEFIGLSPSITFLIISTILKSMGVLYVLDSASGGDVALMESREEFFTRYVNGKSKVWKKPPTTTAVSSTSLHYYDEGNTSNPRLETFSQPPLNDSLPLLSSHCPGWVCYAEKTSPQALNYMSSVKSAQQIIATIIKGILYSNKYNEGIIFNKKIDQEFLNSLSINDINLDEENNKILTKKVYVVSIQPCFDKKLEASRQDFFHSGSNIQEVDLVLSSSELWTLICDYIPTIASVSTSNSPIDSTMIIDSEVPKVTPTLSLSRDQLLKEITNLSSPFRNYKFDEDIDPNHNKLRSPPGYQLYITNIYYLLTLIKPDNPEGRDEIERLFRSSTSDSKFLLSSSEFNYQSGGYTEYLFKYAFEKLTGLSIWNKELKYIPGRNPDIKEVDLYSVLNLLLENNDISQSKVDEIKEKNPNLKFGIANGFRNIQSILMKIRRGNNDLDFIEVMACPSGCNNGGGQIKGGTSLKKAKIEDEKDLETVQMFENEQIIIKNQLIKEDETLGDSKLRVLSIDYILHKNLVFNKVESSPLIKFLYSNNLFSNPLSNSSLKFLHTTFHAVPKLEEIAPLATKW